MSLKLRTFKTFAAAKKAAAGRPIIRVGMLYLVGNIGPVTEIALLAPDGLIVGHVTARHLLRLGNANWAEPHPTHGVIGNLEVLTDRTFKGGVV
jgi:hypothetical protein